MHRSIFSTISLYKLAARLIACGLVCHVVLGSIENPVSGQTTAARRAEIYYGSVRVDGPEHDKSITNEKESAEEVVSLHLSPPLPLSNPSMADFDRSTKGPPNPRGATLSQPRLIPPVAENESSELRQFLTQLRSPNWPTSESAEMAAACTEFDLEDRYQTRSTLELSSLDWPLNSFESDTMKLPIASGPFERDRAPVDLLASVPFDHASQGRAPAEERYDNRHGQRQDDSDHTQSTTSWLATQPLLHFTLGVVVSLISVCTTVSVLLRHWTLGQNAVFRVEMVNGDGQSGVAVLQPQPTETAEQPLVRPRRAAELSELPPESGAFLGLGESYAEKQAKKQEQENQREAAIVQSLFDQNRQWRESSDAIELSNLH